MREGLARALAWAHPPLLAAFPIVYLYSLFPEESSPGRVAFLILGAAAASLVLTALLRAARLGAHAAGLAASAFVTGFMGFGFAMRVTGERVPEMAFTILALAGVTVVAWVGVKLRDHGPNISAVATVVAAFLVATSAFPLPRSPAPHPIEWEGGELEYSGALGPEAPDILYLMLDGYPGLEPLSRVFGAENASFATALEARGFAVAQDARANYPSTALALASVLNMGYAHDLLDPEYDDGLRSASRGMIRENRVMPALSSAGYEIVALLSDHAETRAMPRADVEIDCHGNDQIRQYLLHHTALGIGGARLFAAEARETTSCNVAEIAPAIARQGPTFVFAHLLLPHPPFFFQEDGSPQVASSLALGGVADTEEERAARRALYLEQVRFADALVLETVDRALAEADREVIVVVQSDHGSDTTGQWSADDDDFVAERMRNFVALRAPGVDVPAQMTPVNTFRLLLSGYFGADLPPIEDRSYFASEPHYSPVVDVTERVRGPWPSP